MKFMSTGREMVIVGCIIGAVYLADNDEYGWGWLILLAILLIA